MASSFRNLFKKKEYLLSIDIGSTGIKLIELDCSGEKPKLLNIGISPLTEDIFSNNVIVKAEKVAEQLSALLESNKVGDKRVVTAMPGPSVFTKKIKMQRMDPSELASNVHLEAGNFIPHNVDAVKLDYHILGESGKNQLDILVAAVKDEIIDSFVNTLALAGLQTAVVDVDHFALQNMFEMGYPEEREKTVALINMGARYSSINILRNGESLFTGDIPVGGKLFTDSLVQELGIKADAAEKIKHGQTVSDVDPVHAKEIVDKNVEYVASEFNRQLSFFWNASGAEEGIDKIMLCGGGSLVAGVLEELAEKTGIECVRADPLKGIEVGEGFDEAYLAEISPLMGVSVGMAIRQPGDRMVLGE